MQLISIFVERLYVKCGNKVLPAFMSISSQDGNQAKKIRHRYTKWNVKVDDDFILKYAKKYVEQRSNSKFSVADLEEDIRFKGIGFSAEKIKEIIKKATMPKRAKKEDGAYQDIYRSDLGELLLTSLFEEEIAGADQQDFFVIPIKNISDRELCDKPGRGLDAIGYKENDSSITLLLGEAKVSTEKKNPPKVVHDNHDSIYHTHLRHNSDKSYLLSRLANYVKKLEAKDAACLSVVLWAINEDKSDQYQIVYGCCLLRDVTCVDFEKDYGKLQSEQKILEPQEIHFVISSFDKPIDDAVDLFYKEVMKLTSNEI